MGRVIIPGSALAALAVAALLLMTGGFGKGAVYAAPTNPNITQIAIDMDPANGGGNTGSVLGPIDECIVVAPGATFDINVVMSGLPATPLLTDRLAGINFDIGYSTAAPAVGAPPNLVAAGLVLGTTTMGTASTTRTPRRKALTRTPTTAMARRVRTARTRWLPSATT